MTDPTAADLQPPKAGGLRARLGKRLRTEVDSGPHHIKR